VNDQASDLFWRMILIFHFDAKQHGLKFVEKVLMRSEITWEIWVNFTSGQPLFHQYLKAKVHIAH